MHHRPTQDAMQPPPSRVGSVLITSLAWCLPCEQPHRICSVSASPHRVHRQGRNGPLHSWPQLLVGRFPTRHWSRELRHSGKSPTSSSRALRGRLYTLRNSGKNCCYNFFVGSSEMLPSWHKSHCEGPLVKRCHCLSERREEAGE